MTGELCTAPCIISLSPYHYGKRDWRDTQCKWPLTGNPDKDLVVPPRLKLFLGAAHDSMYNRFGGYVLCYCDHIINFYDQNVDVGKKVYYLNI